MDTICRFSSKADIYAQYRWDYTPEAIEAIFEVTGLSGEAVIADIGSGTGALSRHLVERVRRLFAIEPNPEMRLVAVEALGGYASFCSRAGLAEATGLADNGVDLISVGRAIHWFPDESTRIEFRRILKPGGWLAILRIPCMDKALLEAIKAIQTEENGWNVAGDKSRLKMKPLNFYYGHEEFLSLSFPAVKQETWPEFLGRIASISSAPDKSHPRYPHFEKAARRVFEQFGSNDRITINIATELFLGQM
jgi:SAM-dependent methyltransferase